MNYNTHAKRRRIPYESASEIETEARQQSEEFRQHTEEMAQLYQERIELALADRLARDLVKSNRATEPRWRFLFKQERLEQAVRWLQKKVAQRYHKVVIKSTGDQDIAAVWKELKDSPLLKEVQSTAVNRGEKYG